MDEASQVQKSKGEGHSWGGTDLNPPSQLHFPRAFPCIILVPGIQSSPELTLVGTSFLANPFSTTGEWLLSAEVRCEAKERGTISPPTLPPGQSLDLFHLKQNVGDMVQNQPRSSKTGIKLFQGSFFPV